MGKKKHGKKPREIDALMLGQLAAWACDRWGMEPTAGNMAGVMRLARAHAAEAVEVGAFAATIGQ